jgi:hypothetical protein
MKFRASEVAHIMFKKTVAAPKTLVFVCKKGPGRHVHSSGRLGYQEYVGTAQEANEKGEVFSNFVLKIDGEMARQMGFEPETITVTIEPPR